MNLKKIIIGTAVLSIFAGTTYAEQPEAEEYRQIFESDKFCVEYSLRSYEYGAGSTAKPGKDDPKDIMGRMVLPTAAGKIHGSTSPSEIYIGKFEYLGTGITYAVVNEGTQRIKKWIRKSPAKKASIPFLPIPVQVKDARFFSEPILMYKNGTYYRFSCGDNLNAFQKTKPDKEITATVLLEKDMNSPELDPTEGWNTIRMEMALPEEFAPFCKNDSFRDTANSMPAVSLTNSYKTNLEKEEYDCDVYEGEDGVVYYALYKEGKIRLVQKFKNVDGEDKLIEELFVRKISAEIPADAFVFDKEIPLYGAGMGDANDFLGIPVQVGILGGATNAS